MYVLESVSSLMLCCDWPISLVLCCDWFISFFLAVLRLVHLACAVGSFQYHLLIFCANANNYADLARLGKRRGKGGLSGNTAITNRHQLEDAEGEVYTVH